MKTETNLQISDEISGQYCKYHRSLWPVAGQNGQYQPGSGKNTGKYLAKTSNTWPNEPVDGHPISKKWPDIGPTGKSGAKTGTFWPWKKTGSDQISAGLGSYWPQKLVIFPL
jgi:hypothetical protein